MELCQRRFKLATGKWFFSPEGGTEKATQGRAVVMAKRLPELKECLDNTHMVGFWGCPMQGRELDWMIVFYDSLIELYAMISSSALLKNGYLFVKEEQRRTYHCVDAIRAGTSSHLPAVLMCL